jgi:ABC-type transporter Mla subunit MlaD
MTNDELERIMNFIIVRQERITGQQEQTQSVLTETQSVLGELARRDDDKEQRIARFERSYTTIAGLLERHDTQIVALTDGLNRLTQTVDRYIAARGNNGSNGQ